nr:hypothetical protein [Micromonospora sp. DSM 115978]
MSPILNDFIRGRQVYLLYCLALLRPGRTPPDLPVDPNTAGSIEGWPQADVELLIEEGRRHLDRLFVELDRTRDRARAGIAATLALLVITSAQLPTSAGSCVRLGLFSLSLFLLSLGFLGLLSIAVVQVRVGIIHAGVLSTYTPPVSSALAQDYTA